MPINAHPDYLAAESEYLQAEGKENKIRALKKMISLAPKHKGAENLRKQLKRRLAKLKYTNEKESKKTGSKHGIKKGEMQAVFIGFTNSGKSSILKQITNAHPRISEYEFTTQHPEIGIMNYQGVQIQIIDEPSLGNENIETSIIHTTDLLAIVVTTINEIKKVLDQLPKTNAKKLIIFNKSDKLNKNEKRKISETLKSKKYNFAIISTKTKEGIEELKEKIIENFDIVRIYLKEPGKQYKTDKPLVLKPGATIKDVAEKIKKGLSTQIKQTTITGPSSKFANQRVGLNHKVKDKDIIEFKTR
jgi:small GTP-binding protein